MSTAAEDQATSVAERNSSDPQAPAANGPRNASTASQPIPNGVDSNGGGGGGSSAAMHTAAAGGDRGAAGGSVAGSGGGGGSDKTKQEWQRVKQCVDESVATKLKLLKQKFSTLSPELMEVLQDIASAITEGLEDGVGQLLAEIAEERQKLEVDLRKVAGTTTMAVQHVHNRVNAVQKDINRSRVKLQGISAPTEDIHGNYDLLMLNNKVFEILRGAQIAHINHPGQFASRWNPRTREVEVEFMDGMALTSVQRRQMYEPAILLEDNQSQRHNFLLKPKRTEQEGLQAAMYFAEVTNKGNDVQVGPGVGYPDLSSVDMGHPDRGRSIDLFLPYVYDRTGALDLQTKINAINPLARGGGIRRAFDQRGGGMRGGIRMRGGMRGGRGRGGMGMGGMGPYGGISYSPMQHGYMG